MPATPYRGIQPFRYVDHPIFFAREEETRHLASLVAVYRGVMLYGDSGAGKSSLINAGLLPEAMRLGFHPERLRVQPRSGEELVIERIATAEDEAEFLPSLLAPEHQGSARITLSMHAFEERLRAAAEGHRPLIVFDQFEEVLTLFEQPGAAEAQRRLVELLVALLREPHPVKLLFAFREDYLGKVKQLLAASPELVDQALRLAPPEADTLPTIIRGPFERYPGHFARELNPEVTDRLCAALTDRFGAGDLSLSEVQTVCLRLWQADEPEELLAAKGPQGLLEDYLGEALDALSPELRGAAIALLGQMVTSAGTRNVLSAEDLIERAHEHEHIPPALSERALERLENDSKLVRRERRRDLYLYEITSEFLLPWIGRRQEGARRLQDRARDRRRLRILASVTAALVLVVVVLIVLVSSGNDGAVAVREVKVGQGPSGLAAGKQGIWVTNRDSNTVSLIEATPDSQKVKLQFPVGAAPEGIAVDDNGSAWVANHDDNTVSRIDPSGRAVSAPIDVGPSPDGVAVDPDGSVWVALGATDQVARLDPADGAVDQFNAGDDPNGVAVGSDGLLWVTNRGPGAVSRIDPTRPDRSFQIRVGSAPKGIAVAENAVWVANTLDESVSRIDPASFRTREFPVGAEPRDVVVAFGSIWVSLGGDDQVARLDPETGHVDQRIDVGGGPDGITAGPDSVWVANGEDNTVSRISP